MRENVEVAALGVGASAREARARAPRPARALGLEARADGPAGALPHGDERKLGVARALATAPRFVLMDEPAAGLHRGGGAAASRPSSAPSATSTARACS